MVRTALHSVVTPKPSCTTCGAVAKEGLPKIPMVQRGEKRPETNMMWKWHGKRVMRFEP